MSNKGEGVILVSDDSLSSNTTPHNNDGKVSDMHSEIVPSMEVQESECRITLTMVDSLRTPCLSSQVQSYQLLDISVEQYFLLGAIQLQAKQVNLGRGNKVLAALQQQEEQVVHGQARQARMLVAATPQDIEMNQQVMLKLGLLVPCQSMQHNLCNQAILNQGMSK